MMRIYVRKRGECKPGTGRVAAGGGSGHPFRALLRRSDLPLILQCLFGPCLKSAPSSRSQRSEFTYKRVCSRRGQLQALFTEHRPTIPALRIACWARLQVLGHLLVRWINHKSPHFSRIKWVAQLGSFVTDFPK